MSNWREQLSEESESKAVLAWLSEYYHVPILLFIVGFTFWNRIRNWGRFVVDGEVIFGGNDPWYHWRSTEYASRHFPETMPFDPWTQFPLGTFSAQFGTLVDQVVALFALLVGLGNPDQFTTRFLMMISPAFWVVIVALVAYLLGRRLGGRFGGLVAAGVVAFAPDRLQLLGQAGSPDHHSPEALFMALGMLGIMVALTVAEKEKPVYELVAAREFDALRRPIGWSLLAGVAIGLYLWVWPPGIWLYGILGAFFIVHLSIEHVRGRSPEHPAFVGVIALSTAGVMQIPAIRAFELSATGRSLIQPGMGFAVAAGVVFLAWLSREVESRDLSRFAYPGAVAASIILSAGLTILVLPDIFDFFVSQTDRVLGFITSPSETAGTIGEAQPASRNDFDRWYKLANFTAILGAAVILARQVINDEPRGEELLVVIWMTFIVAATLTQIRFGYYLTVPMGMLNAALVGFVMQTMGAESVDADFDIELYQVLTVLVVVMVIFVPMIGPFGIFEDGDQADTTMELTDAVTNPGGVVGWKDSLDWMNENTPMPGQYANPDGEQIDLYGQYDLQDDYEYPDGAYGVMSWWDYGHWITGQAERIPNANPFQQGSDEAALFLLAQNEETAEEVLSTVDEDENAKTRYVMIDWKMVESWSQPLGGKFFAPFAFTDQYEVSNFFTSLDVPREDGQVKLTNVHKQPYYESMVTRLYHFHGSAQGVSNPTLGVPIVEWDGVEREYRNQPGTFVEFPSNGTAIRFVDSLAEAREITQDNPSAQIGGLGAMPTERVPALEHYRLVQMSDVNALGRGEASIRANEEHNLNFFKQRFTRRTIFGSGLAREINRAINQDQSITQQQTLQEMQQNPQLQNRILGVGERVLYPNTPAWTKVFERVPGATIEGTNGPPNSVVRLRVTIEPENGRSFDYRQRVETDEDGTFSTTVPYATEGYENWGPEDGYTNASIRANGSYLLQTGFSTNAENETVRYVGTANVTEAQVIGEDPSPVEVELSEQVLQIGSGNGGEGGEDGESGSGDSDSGSDSGSDETESVGPADRPDVNVPPTLRARL